MMNGETLHSIPKTWQKKTRKRTHCFVLLRESVVPKIANPRNHQGADTDASTRGFISKLELGSKYTPHSGAGTWTPKWVTAGFFIGWSRGFPEGMEEF